jgi:hypothetical protein
MRSLGVLLALSVAVAAHADSADVGVTTNLPQIVRAGDQANVDFFINNAGPDIARNVVLTITTSGLPQAQLPCPNGRCVIGDLGPNQGKFIVFGQTMPISDFTFTVSAMVTSDTPDPKPESNSASTTIRVATAPRLLASFQTVDIISGQPLEPAQPFQVQGFLYNQGFSPAHDVVVTLNLPEGASVKSLPANCSASGLVATCHIDSIAPGTDYQHPGASLPMTFVAPPMYDGGQIVLTYTVQHAEGDFDDSGSPHGTFGANLIRTLLVTTSADDGPGSLRAVINDANTRCVPILPNATQAGCGIAFNIDEPGTSPWKTIRLKSPLPSLRTLGTWIDGGTQAGFSGVPNPNGPSIEISGGGMVNGDGLLDEESCITVSGLAINGFLGNGISLGRETCSTSLINVTNNYIGTDPTGSVAVPNFRGIGSVSGFDDIYRMGYNIYGNVISGNVRSGLFLAGGAWIVSNNRIGLKAHADEALPNGGSGVFLSAAVIRATLSNNAIAFNGEMGVAIDPLSLYVYLTHNAIWGNGGLAIDDGLDGPSASVRTDTTPLGVPVITSAVYDPILGETSIRGIAAATYGVEIFASDFPGPGGAAEAKRFLSGGFCVDFTQCKSNEFFVKFKADMRGQWIAATASLLAKQQPAADIYTVYRTSELGVPVQVR